MPLLACLLFLLAVTGPVQNLSAQVEDNGPVRVHYEMNSDDSYSIFADNSFPIPCYVKVEFHSLQNLNSTVPLPFETVVPAQAKRIELFRLIPVKGKQTYFNYSANYILGDPIGTVPESEFPYLFPFEHGKKYKLVQGFNGKFTHFGQNTYSLDFEMPEGTPVCAARDGIVVETKASSSINGLTPEFNQYNNFIRIYHSDGTFGFYVHLRQNGVIVAIGDQVKAGQVIGYSGNTGLSSAPHLHFDVRVPTRKDEYQSIPIKMMNYDSKPVVPVAGWYYYSLHPGAEKFTVELGRMLRNEYYNGYIEKAPLTGIVDIRTAQLDDTYIVFLVNGTSSPVKATAKLELHNLQSSTGNPVTLTIPAQSEVFLTLLNPDDPLEAYGFNSSVNATWAK